MAKLAGKRKNPDQRTGVTVGLPLRVLGSHTARRCTATHDVPYTLRCTLDSRHVGGTYPRGGVVSTALPVPHRDKDGREWTDA